MKKLILLLLLVVIGAGAWYGYKKFTGKNPDLSDKAPDFTVDAPTLIAAFDKDSAAASKQYVGKLVQVTGAVSKIDTAGVISLGKQGEMSSVQCTMDHRHPIDYTKFKEGQNITIKGTCSGYNAEEMLGEKLGTNVQLNFSVIVNNQ